MSKGVTLLRRLVAVLAHDQRHRARAEVTPASLTYFSPGRSRSVRERRRRTRTSEAPAQFAAAGRVTRGDDSDARRV